MRCTFADRTGRLPPRFGRRRDASYPAWRELFAADGLHPDRILVVQYAAEGLAMATGYDDLARTEDLARALPLLLSLTDDDGPLPPPAHG